MIFNSQTLVRDHSSGAILSTDDEKLLAILKEKEAKKNQKKRIDCLEQRIYDLEKIVFSFINKKYE